MADDKESKPSSPSKRSKQHALRSEFERAVLASVGQAVRNARASLGRSIASVAAETELDPAYLGEVERGRANLSVTTLAALAAALRVPARELLPKPSGQEVEGSPK